jgi:hypothetical protein
MESVLTLSLILSVVSLMLVSAHVYFVFLMKDDIDKLKHKVHAQHSTVDVDKRLGEMTARLAELSQDISHIKLTTRFSKD